MTGENFLRCSGNSMKDIKVLKEKLENAKRRHGEYVHRNNENFTWDSMYKIEDEIKQLEYELYCAEYEDNRRRNWNR